MIEANASLADRFAILTSIPGVSNITAFALLIAMPELGALGPPSRSRRSSTRSMRRRRP